MKHKYLNNIEFISRAIIIKNQKILLCYGEKSGYYYFPGGHVEFGETAKVALKREIKEETSLSSKIGSLIGIVENFFTEKRIKHHEINFVFTATIPTEKVASAESHINFKWLDLKDTNKKTIFPVLLKKNLIKWLKTRKPFLSV